jgi:hypothetical protein
VFGRQGEGADFVEAVFEEERVGLFVGEALAAANDGVGVGVGLGAALRVEDEEDGFGETSEQSPLDNFSGSIGMTVPTR